MSDANSNCAVVLSGGAAASLAPVLARLFGIDARLAGQIAGAAPIVLVDNLSESQAAGVSAALAEMAAAGARLEVKTGSLGSLPRVGWPGGPRIAGKPAVEYTAPFATGPVIEGQLRCPCCGAALRLVPIAGPAAPGPAARAAAAPAMGKRDSGFEEIPLPEALKALEGAPPELPDVPDVPEAKPAKAKAEPPPPVAKGAVSVRNAKPGSSSPMALEEFEAGLASDDKMLADLDEGLPQVPDEKPKPVPIKLAPAPQTPPPRPARVEEIGVAPAAPKPAAAPPQARMVRPMTPQEAARHVAARPATAVPSAPAAAKPGTAASGDPTERVNIYINKTNNPKVHELMAKLHNVSAEEAAELCNKTLVTVAKGVSRQQADVIKKKLNEYKVSARLSTVRLSQRTEPQEGEEGAGA